MKGEARSGTWPEQVSREHNLVVTSVIVSAARPRRGLQIAMSRAGVAPVTVAC